MNRSSQSSLDAILRQEETLDQLIARTGRITDIQFASWALPITQAFEQLARLHVLANHIEHARGQFANAAKFSIELQRLGAGQRYRNLVRRDDPPAFHLAFIHTFVNAILSADDALLREVAVTFEEPSNIQSDRRFPHFMTAALKHMVLGNATKAREFVVAAHKLEFFRLPYKGFSHALLGIIDQDRLLLNEGIELRLRAHKVRDLAIGATDFSPDATALARLAHRAGLTVQVASPLLKRELLDGTETRMDERMNTLLQGLERADKRQGSWWAKIWNPR